MDVDYLVDGGIDLLPRKRQRTDSETVWDWCVICQDGTSKVPFVNPGKQGITRLCQVADSRMDSVYRRLQPDIDNLMNNNVENVKWHKTCYSSYTSQTNINTNTNNSNTSLNVSHTRESSGHVAAFDPDRCIFCKHRKYGSSDAKGRTGKLSQVSTESGADRIQEAARRRQDEVWLRINGIDLMAAGIKYHKTCRAAYVNEVSINAVQKKHEGNWSPPEMESPVKSAFQQLVREIDDQVITRGIAVELSVLSKKYADILMAKGTQQLSSVNKRLKDMITAHYGTSITFQQQMQKNESLLVYSSHITKEDVITQVKELRDELNSSGMSEEMLVEDTDTERMTLEHAAAILHTALKNSSGLDYSHGLNIEDFSSQKAKELLPTTVYTFLYHVMTGRSIDEDVIQDQHDKGNIHRHVLSIGQDLVYAASQGNKKMPKHLGLGITVRHLTNSAQLVKMLNRLGHTISYDEMERIDTALAQSQMDGLEKDKVTIPSNIRPGTFVHAAADNSDFIEDTLDGRNTTHATSLVLYQRKQETTTPGQTLLHGSFPKSAVRHRTLVTLPSSMNITEFHCVGKRPSPSSILGTVDPTWFLQTSPVPDNGEAETGLERNLDWAWMLSRLLPCKLFEVDVDVLAKQKQSVPGWTAFNATLSATDIPVTSVGYCPMFPASATSYSTIYTVMQYVQKTMTMLGQHNSVITFDEAIYCKAKEIQWRHSDEFANMVIRLGGFHMVMVFLAILGQRSGDGGLEDILIESLIYGTNTIMKILRGSAYSRAVRAHKTIYEALQRLLWQEMCQWVDVTDHSPLLNEEVILTLLHQCASAMATRDNKDAQRVVGLLCPSLTPLLDLMEQFKKAGLAQSPTFAWWCEYLEMVEILLDFIRAEREGRWELHLNTVAQMLPYFFAYDHTNYARWATVYLADMRELPMTAPLVHTEFVSGNFTVKRSNNRFNQVWSDMALEQSVNRDSKTQGGLKGITLKPAALNRWFLTVHKRAEVVTATKEMCGMATTDQAGSHKEFGTNRLLRDEKDVQAVVDTVSRQMINPFRFNDLEKNETLLNISTGRVATAEEMNDMLNAKQIGSEALTVFVNERLHQKKKGLFDPLPKTKLKTFKEHKKSVVVKHTDKTTSMYLERDMFIRLLVVAKSRDIDLHNLLTYELSAVPFSLSKGDGSLLKCNKSTLLAELEQDLALAHPPPTDYDDSAWIIDGMAVLQMLKMTEAKTFGDLSQIVLRLVLKPLQHDNCSRVDVLFDRYDERLSIKSGERARRAQQQTVQKIAITRSEQQLPKQFDKYMTDSDNKAALANYLSEDWCTRAREELKEGHQLILGGGFRDRLVTRKISNEGVSDMHGLSSTHEEADTRIILHANNISKDRIIIWSPDTDVAILAISFYNQIPAKELWFRTGVKDRARFIPIHDLARKLDGEMCDILPAVHALTGCDSTSAFSGKGKIKPWRLAVSRKEEFKELAELGTEPELSRRTFVCVEDFTAALYGQPYDDVTAGSAIDYRRYVMLTENQCRNELLPPTQDALHQHAKRACYQTYIWRNSCVAKPVLPTPVGFGWEEDATGHLQPVLMTKEAAPKALVEVITCRCDPGKSGCRGRCSCAKKGLECTQACRCNASPTCQNKYKTTANNEEHFDSDSDTE